MSLFESAASDYARHRPGIPEEVVRLLAKVLKGIDQPVLLDLGAGTGQVPAALIPAVPHIVRVDLVDPDEAMLHEAAARLPSLPSGGTIAFHAMPAEEFTAPYGGYRAHLVTCARAFHWMSRPAVLAIADRVTAPAATFALIGDGSLWTHPASWAADLKQLVQSYLGKERRAGTTGVYTEPGRRYQDDLAESAFSDIAEHQFPVRRTWTPTAVVGYLRSTSFARPALFGDRHARFEQEARSLLEEHALGEGLVEDAVFTVLLARRPGCGR
ncbi:class I SAM-dependent methyltransferase [Streptomyces yokosukanensis]|uniref:class I SAM-dependent methyltransferase n=1 Tax=Streptomyces yokosukanensis TaxID=67386 RepID=UPI00082AC77C|nr:class I SAM-dependent methyltransferase [Streptomyces yokosukanensis]